MTLESGVTYVVVNALENLARSPSASFTVGQASSGASAPTPAATVGVYDFAYGMPATLPRRGVVRFENRGQKLHIAVAFRLRPGASRPAAVRALIRNQERQLGRLIVERDVIEPLGLVSGGAATDVEVNFPRTGNWVFACFISDGEQATRRTTRWAWSRRSGWCPERRARRLTACGGRWRVQARPRPARLVVDARERAQPRDRLAQHPRDLHLADADALADLGLGQVPARSAAG